MLNLFNSSFATMAFWVLAPLSLIASAYALVSAIRGWHKNAYVPVERYLALKSHAREDSNNSCYFAEKLKEVSDNLEKANEIVKMFHVLHPEGTDEYYDHLADRLPMEAIKEPWEACGSYDQWREEELSLQEADEEVDPDSIGMEDAYPYG